MFATEADSSIFQSRANTLPPRLRLDGIGRPSFQPEVLSVVDTEATNGLELRPALEDLFHPSVHFSEDIFRRWIVIAGEHDVFLVFAFKVFKERQL